MGLRVKRETGFWKERRNERGESLVRRIRFRGRRIMLGEKEEGCKCFWIDKGIYDIKQFKMERSWGVDGRRGESEQI